MSEHVRRLRPLPTEEELAQMYPVPHDHTLYGRGHEERVEATVRLARAAFGHDPGDVADLSCGNGYIARALQPFAPQRHLGDLAGVSCQIGEHSYLGPLEQTLELLPDSTVDVYICSETLEHLDDPLLVLRTIRGLSHQLVLSTPLECWDDDNVEHLWAWDQLGVEELLQAANWLPRAFVSVDSREYGETYLYGIWVCS